MSVTPSPKASPRGRSGSQTRQHAQRIALQLFTEQGYEATSLRQIADELGINKASLYYHFDGKEAILQSLIDDRGDETFAHLAWVRDQDPGVDVVERAVLRWVDSFSEDKLRGIRFLAANPLLLRTLSHANPANRIGEGLNQLAEELANRLNRRTPENALLIRMALLSINAAVQASVETAVDDDEILATARSAALALVRAATAPSDR